METVNRIAYNRKDAAAALGVSLPTFDRLRQRPDFPFMKIGNCVMIPRVELEKWISEVYAASSNRQ